MKTRPLLTDFAAATTGRDGETGVWIELDTVTVTPYFPLSPYQSDRVSIAQINILFLSDSITMRED